MVNLARHICHVAYLNVHPAVKCNFYLRRGRNHTGRALARALEALQENPRDPNAYLQAARYHQALGQHEDATAVLKEGVARCVPSLDLYGDHIRSIEKCNRTREAIAAAEATRVFPDDVFVKLKEALLLPMLYDTSEEVEFYRRRYTEGLRRLCAELPLDSPQARPCGGSRCSPQSRRARFA
jgi:protein O-GlcNAc transferase